MQKSPFGPKSINDPLCTPNKKNVPSKFRIMSRRAPYDRVNKPSLPLKIVGQEEDGTIVEVNMWKTNFSRYAKGGEAAAEESVANFIRSAQPGATYFVLGLIVKAQAYHE